LALLQKSQGDQFVDSLAYGVAADVQGCGQLPFGHDFLAGLKVSAKDQFPKLIEYLIGNPLGTDGFEPYFHESNASVNGYPTIVLAATNFFKGEKRRP
jgi:hypothetical protein